MSPHWTKDLPKELGYYWYREDAGPMIVELYTADTDMPWIMRCGTDVPWGPDFMHKITGQFWSERLSPPKP